jgi:hypothetical protein
MVPRLQQRAAEQQVAVLRLARLPSPLLVQTRGWVVQTPPCSWQLRLAHLLQVLWLLGFQTRVLNCQRLGRRCRRHTGSRQPLLHRCCSQQTQTQVRCLLRRMLALMQHPAGAPQNRHQLHQRGAWKQACCLLLPVLLVVVCLDSEQRHGAACVTASALQRAN